MERLQRISWALLLVAAGCSDDVSSASDGSTGGDESSTGSTVDPTNVTTTIDPTASTSTSSSTGDPDTGSTTDDTTTGPTTGDTDPDTDSTTSTTDAETTGTTGDPVDCGNDMLDGREACDGAELDGATCESLGFASGDLSCADDCTYDTAACESCGNDVVDKGEDCEGDDLADATCQSIDMGFTGGVLACDATCGFDTTGCTSVAYPAAGEVIVSEIMPNPTAVADADGEWFELHNPSATDTYQLNGCEISGQAGEEAIVIPFDFLIAPGAYLSFAPESMVDPGFTPDFGYTESFSVANGGDIITLSCDGVTVDTVDYDAFPPEAGVSLNLDPDFFDATANDAAENWCPGVNIYLDPDTGTPGAANDECIAPAVYTIDFCRMQSPDTIVEDFDTVVDVYGRVYIAGLTDISTSNDLAPELSAQLGYGPDGTDPAVDAGWTWVDAIPNAGYTAVAPEENNDEYVVSLTVPAPGEYDYAYRFSGDSEGSYTYCDGQPAGNSDGYQVENAGQMTAGGEVLVPDSLIITEVYYDNPGADNELEWVKLFNGTGADVDLSAYSLGHGGTDYTFGTYQLAGTIAAGECFVVGGPNASADNGFMEPPAYDQGVVFTPNIQNSGGTADGVALFDVTADSIAPDTIPIDAVIFGGSNDAVDDNALIDETGTAPAPDVGDAPSGDSIALLTSGNWAIRADPTPTVCQFAE
ncbi:MAG: lamin tail domain-containing protein [Nannocystales bacterium]